MFDFEARLTEFHSERLNDVAVEFVSDNADVPRYVLGRNHQALMCAERTRIFGLVDDFAPRGSVWKGIPVIHGDLLPLGAIVVNCSMSIRPLSAEKRLRSVAGARVVSYADLVRANSKFPLPDFVRTFRADYAENEARWRAVNERLSDERSRKILSTLMLYRLTGDYRHMSGFSVRIQDQYFDPVAILSDAEVFVDCGGFDGDTVLEFCSRNQNYRHIYMFEPSPENFERAKTRLRDVRDLTLFRFGVSEARGRLSFDAGAGSASAVSGAGSLTIDVVTIDEFISEPVTYIKMDLEGWELHALKGAKRHIVDEHPKLAIAVYHRASDFWRIPEYVLRLRDDYDVYVRHYTEGWSETVMYFVPRLAGSLHADH